MVLAHPLRVRQAVSLICHDGHLSGRYDLNNHIPSDERRPSSCKGVAFGAQPPRIQPPPSRSEFGETQISRGGLDTSTSPLSACRQRRWDRLTIACEQRAAARSHDGTWVLSERVRSKRKSVLSQPIMLAASLSKEMLAI